MASVPTAEESARQILRIFLKFGCRPTHVLRINNFFSDFTRPPWHPSDIMRGLQLAAERGWVEILDSSSFGLAELGFSKADEADHVDIFSECNDRVTIEGQDGQRRENVPALITENMILIPDPSLPIAPNDVILRQIPSGLVDRFIVTEPGFKTAFHEIPAHYQIKYRREGQKPAGEPGYIVHVSGENARVNINSVDNSSNVVVYKAEQLVELSSEFERLRSALLDRASSAEHYAAIGAIASAEVAAKSGESSRIDTALSTLGAAGRWVFETAKEIGVQLVAEVLKSYLKLP